MSARCLTLHSSVPPFTFGYKKPPQNLAKHSLCMNKQNVQSVMTGSCQKSFYFPQKSLTISIEWKKSLQRSGWILWLMAAVSVINKYPIVPTEDVPSLKDSARRKLFALVLQARPCNHLLLLFQTAVNWTRTKNNKHGHVFQDHFVTEQLQQLLSALLFYVDALELVMRHIFVKTLISTHVCKILWLNTWTANKFLWDCPSLPCMWSLHRESLIL